MIENKSRDRYIGIATLMVFCFLMLPVAVFSQAAPGNIMGFVYDKDGKTPLKDARVVLKKVKAKKSDKEYKSDPTGETGDYKMENIPEGRYRALIVIKDGKIYPTLSVVNVIAEKTVIRSFHLAPKRPFLAFFYEPCGIAMLIAGTAVVTKLVEPPASPTVL
jgi:hypothetical protein